MGVRPGTALLRIPELRSAVLELARTSGPTRSGTTYNVTYRLSNTGNETATDVRMTAPIAPGKYQSVTGATCEQFAASLTCRLPDISVNGNRFVTLRFTPAAAEYDVAVGAIATRASADPVTTTIPSTTARLSLARTSGPTLTDGKYNITYRITNNGDSDSDKRATHRTTDGWTIR